MANFQVTPSVAKLYDEFKIQGLYMYHTPLGENANQTSIVDSNGPLGNTVVNNWAVYDRPGPNAMLIARAQGLHIQAGNWLNVFSLVFEDGRFSGSTLQVMGISVETGEWAIVGGTGKLAMATGVISKKLHEQRSDGNIIELTIHVLFPELQGFGHPLVSLGPWGGDGGSDDQFIPATPTRLESITIRSGTVIDSIAFDYIDHAGQKHSAGPMGGTGGNSHTIELAPSEFITEVSGTVGSYKGFTVVTSLKFVSNFQKTHGPFGENNGTPFVVPIQSGSGVFGFFARSGQYLDAIGLYVRRI